MKLNTTLFIAGASILYSGSALAQSPNANVVHEAIPAQRNVILANSAEDLALQDEIRKIRAYNAYVDAKVGITDDPVHVNPYQHRQVELYQQAPAQSIQSTARITYSPTDTSNQVLSVTPTTIVRRMPQYGSTTIHQVAKGDTLYSLARSKCVSVRDIQTQNALGNNNIRLGQALTLPASKCANASRASQSYVREVEPVPVNVNITQPNYNYAVLPKDTLYSIGKRYCVTPNAIASQNSMSMQQNIQPGQILTLPKSACLN